MYRVVIFVLLMFCSLLLFSQEIILKAEVLIDSSSNQIFLSDFAVNPEVLSELGKEDIIFGYAPMPGRSMKVSLEYVVGKFKRYLKEVQIIQPDSDIIDVYRMALSGELENASEEATGIDLETSHSVNRLEIFDEKALKSMFLNAFEQKIEVNFDEKLDIQYEQFPPTPFKAKIESINVFSKGSKKYMIRIEYLTEEGKKSYETALFTVSWPVKGIITNKLIRKDVLLSEEYLVFQLIDYFDYKAPVLSSQMTSDYVAKLTISEGQVLEWGMLKKRAYVLKGQIISAVVQLSGVEVTSKVEMLENGEIGQLLRGKNIDTGIMVTGILDEGPVLRVSY